MAALVARAKRGTQRQRQAQADREDDREVQHPRRRVPAAVWSREPRVGCIWAWLGRLVGFVIAIALDVGLFIAALKWLTDRDVNVKDVLPGAALSGVVFWLLQQLSGFIISNRLQTRRAPTAASPPPSRCCGGSTLRASLRC
ncbi:MAG: hypothetical protein ACR2LE_01655 [Nocardioidaceae bacterium]